MGNLVAQYTCQFAFIVSGFNQTAIDIDKSTWKSKGVNLFGIDQLELIRQIGVFGMFGNAFPQVIQIAFGFGIVKQVQLLFCLPGSLSANFHVLLDGEEIHSGPELSLP